MNYRLVLLCSAALASSAAIAEDTQKPAESADTFKSVDVDGDGKISKTEATANAAIASNFEALDGNSDGYVSKREFRRNTMPKPKPSY